MRGLILIVLLFISSTANLSFPYIIGTVCIEPVIEEVEIKNDFIYSLRKYDKQQLLDTLLNLNIFDSTITQLSSSNLKRLYSSYRYDFLISQVSDSTGFSKAFVFAYFNYEAIGKQGETKLFREHWNPGGIKSYSGNFTLAYDDCGSVPCRFASMSSFKEGIDKWVKVLNQKRYEKCKKVEDEVEQCACMRDAGYHTDPKIMGRVSLIRKYIEYDKYFQADYRSKRESS